MNADMKLSIGEVNFSLSVTESAIAELWREVLGVPAEISATDDFFQLGGDSIDMVTVLFRIQEELSVELPVESMFTAPTLQELAALVDATSKGAPIPAA